MRCGWCVKLVSVPPSQRLVDIEHVRSAAASTAMDSCACFLVPTNRMRLAVGGDVADEVVRVVDLADGLLKVDDVDAVTLGEDVRRHLGVPSSGLMSEMDACFEQLLHGYDWHKFCLLNVFPPPASFRAFTLFLRKHAPHDPPTCVLPKNYSTKRSFKAIFFCPKSRVFKTFSYLFSSCAASSAAQSARYRASTGSSAERSTKSAASS